MSETELQASNGKREQNKEKNRQLILTAAKKAFTESGFDAVSIRDIIRETDLASGTFYNYFADKEAVFVAVMKQEVLKVSGTLSEIRNAATDLRGFVYDSYLFVFRFFHAEPKMFELIDRNEQQVRELYKFGVLTTTMNDLKNDINQAVSSGLIPKVDVDYLAAVLYGLGYEMVRVMVSRGDQADPDEAARIAAEFVLTGASGVSKPD